MIYFDTDVLIHYFVKQEVEKQAIARTNVDEAFDLNKACISILTLQEVSFVMSKLGLTKDEIGRALSDLKQFTVLETSVSDFERAEKFAQAIGFQNINDCLHTALAERHCHELQTFNFSDFLRIQPLTSLKTTLL